MTKKFDKKAETLLKNGREEQLQDVLKEYAQYVCLDCGKDVENPDRFLEELNIKEGIKSLTEFRVAKGMVREKVRQSA